MPLAIATEPVPFTVDSDGVARVGKTRVTLDTVVAAFLEGATAEEIVQQYPTVDLADIYSVIGYFLRRRQKWMTMCSGADNRQKYSENRMSRGLIRAVCASVCWPAGLTKLPNTCSGLPQMRISTTILCGACSFHHEGHEVRS